MINRIINNIRGRRYRRKDKKHKLPWPSELYMNILDESRKKYNSSIVYDLGNKDVFQRMKSQNYFHFDAGWCNAWPDTLGLMKKDRIFNDDGWLRFYSSKLGIPEEGFYWDEELKERIIEKRSIGVPYLESTHLFQPPLRIVAWVKINAFRGGWTAPLWMSFKTPDSIYEEIDVNENWYEGGKMDKRSQANIHHKSKGKRKMNPGKIRFAKPHENKELLLVCDVTPKHVKIYYNGFLVYKTRKNVPKHNTSFICGSMVKLMGQQNDIIDLYATLPGYFDVKNIAVFCHKIISPENQKLVKMRTSGMNKFKKTKK